MLIVLGIFLILILWSLLEQKLLVTTRYSTESDSLPKAFHNTGFVVLSDLHNRAFGKNNERLIKKIEKLSPDFIIVAGDMINKQEVCCPSNSFSLLSQLAKKYKIYYAFGNHEQRLEKLLSSGLPIGEQECSNWVEYKEALAELKVTFLDNNSILFEKNGERLRITGVSIEEKYFEHGKQHKMEEEYIPALLGEKPEGMYEILIAHNPAYFFQYVRWGADLILSGHLHGGMVRLPLIGGIVSPQVWLFPKYSSGIHTENGGRMVVSRGLGSHSLMPRLFNAPEIIQVILKCADK